MPNANFIVALAVFLCAHKHTLRGTKCCTHHCFLLLPPAALLLLI